MRKTRRKAAPMLVMRGIREVELDTKELSAALAFKFGTATKADYDMMMDITNMMLIAASTAKHREYVIPIIDNSIMPTLKSIRERYERTNKLGVSAEESKVLVDLTEISKQFWLRQPLDLYKRCATELALYYEELFKKRAATCLNESSPEVAEVL